MSKRLMLLLHNFKRGHKLLEKLGRFGEASSFAGYAAMIQAVTTLVATGGTDPTAWGILMVGLVAVFKREKK